MSIVGRMRRPLHETAFIGRRRRVYPRNTADHQAPASADRNRSRRLH
ncbi:MAG: hypothetical protein AAF086_09440 [Planctomycetota bacterium]